MVRDTLLQNVAGTPFDHGDMVYNSEQNTTLPLLKKQNKAKYPFLQTGESAHTGKLKGHEHAFLEMEVTLRSMLK